jgi:hypothetical protein
MDISLKFRSTLLWARGCLWVVNQQGIWTTFVTVQIQILYSDFLVEGEKKTSPAVSPAENEVR